MKINKNIFLTALLSLTMMFAYGQKFVFYLHGAIVETQGANAVDTMNGYGPYKYLDIIDSLKKRNVTVLSEVRKPGTNVKEYAAVIASQVDSLLRRRVKPSDITVIGASKGAVIAMYVSSFLRNKNVNFVFMGACTDALFTSSPDIVFYGNVLSIYEKTDFSNTCFKFKNESKAINNYKEVALGTGLRHGFLYRPLTAWLEPVTKWINNDYH